MGFLSDLFSGFFDEPQAPKKPDVPDLGTYWKQYTGWISNINQRTEGELADVRARMSAQGASPDALMMATENLESQRKSEIASLEGGQTFRFLQEGFEIATGKRPNPYAGDLPGMGSEQINTGMTSGGEGGTNEPIFETKYKTAQAGSMSEYYSSYFGGASGPDAADAGEEAKLRAKMAAGGSAPKGGGASGAGASPALVTKEQNFWS